MIPAHKAAFDYDVVVVGYGPTGLVAASLLGQAGHKVAVVERWPSLYGLPRLTHMDGETARIVQACGDIDHAMRHSSPLDAYRYFNAEGELLLELDWKGQQCGYPAHNSIFQPEIEDAIHDRVASLPNVELFRGWQVVALDQGTDGSTLTIEPSGITAAAPQTHQDLTSKQFTARFVYGADGANSFVRQALGIERNDYGHKHRWLNLDSENLSEAAQRFNLLSVFCDPARGHMYMPIGTNRTRFELRVLPHESNEEWESEAAGWRWLQDKYGIGPQDFKLIRHVVYTFQSRLADRWIDRNVLLGGDAAHAMMPYMGQGACSGMRDSINLAWKLDLVLTGRSSPALLSTYEEERRPHAKKITEMSLYLGQVTNEDDPVKAAARDQAFRSKNIPPMPPFPRIEGGVLHHQSDGSLQPSTGHPGPQSRVVAYGVEGRLDTVVGNGFLLVSRVAPSQVLDAAQQKFLDQLGCRIVVIGNATQRTLTPLDDNINAFMDTHDMQAYLARPDFIVFGSVSTIEQLPALVDDLRSKLHWQGA